MSERTAYPDIIWCGKHLQDMDRFTTRDFIDSIVLFAKAHPDRFADVWADDLKAIFAHLATLDGHRIP